MVSRPRAVVSWSGGKDSYAALARTAATYDIAALLTMFVEDGTRTRSHGLRPELIGAQADRLGLHVIGARCSWKTYNDAFVDALCAARDLGATHAIFGDLLFPEHRAWAEARCAEAGMTAVEPLWGESTPDLFDAFIESSATALMVTVREPMLDETWLGLRLCADMKPEFARRGVDPCGERGEYHTAMVEAPLFSSPIRVTGGRRVRQGECVAVDLIPEGPSSPIAWVERRTHAAGV